MTRELETNCVSTSRVIQGSLLLAVVITLAACGTSAEAEMRGDEGH